MKATVRLSSVQPLTRKLNRAQRSAGWLWITGGGFTVLCLNWRLVLATATGVAVMAFAYRAQGWSKRSVGLRLRQLWHHPNARLTVAVLAGTLGVLGCYLVLALVESEKNPWLGFAHGAQFIATFGILGVVAYQLIRNQSQEEDIDALFLHLASPEPLARLIAVRQLHARVLASSLSFTQEKHLKEYCLALLEQESSPITQEAVLEMIDTLQYLPVTPRYVEKHTIGVSMVETPKFP